MSIQQHRSIVVRNVGHEVLLLVGDSTSLVFPVSHANERYQLRFATEFGFQPFPLAARIDSIMALSHISAPYFVEVISCHDKSVVYSYEVGGYTIEDTAAIVPCGVREYPKGCYEIAVTFAAYGQTGSPAVKADAKSNPASKSSSVWLWWIIPILAISILGIYLLRKRKNSEDQFSHIIAIGAYKFDKRNMHLTYRDETVELTSKEADLLFLLHSSANETIERDTILRIVWGDEGDYVGRTLDVFISKLRKKLAADPAIKITNIRGVGYRLVVDYQ
ncbi:MAG: hypothetical protein Crog4KO_07480 [Crocinitomicaceae bacterium]